MIDNNGRSPKHIKTRLKVIVGPQSPNRLLKMQSACFGLGGNRTFRPLKDAFKNAFPWQRNNSALEIAFYYYFITNYSQKDIWDD